ncbi:hypothetical protein DFH06DRAFT_1399000 [Mycena polygramma]|nr:hypothetical protein DFH06DRAFT_1399000 [Mycena polygramma]
MAHHQYLIGLMAPKWQLSKALGLGFGPQVKLQRRYPIYFNPNPIPVSGMTLRRRTRTERDVGLKAPADVKITDASPVLAYQPLADVLNTLERPSTLVPALRAAPANVLERCHCIWCMEFKIHAPLPWNCFMKKYKFIPRATQASPSNPGAPREQYTGARLVVWDAGWMRATRQPSLHPLLGVSSPKSTSKQVLHRQSTREAPNAGGIGATLLHSPNSLTAGCKRFNLLKNLTGNNLLRSWETNPSIYSRVPTSIENQFNMMVKVNSIAAPFADGNSASHDQGAAVVHPAVETASVGTVRYQQPLEANPNSSKFQWNTVVVHPTFRIQWQPLVASTLSALINDRHAGRILSFLFTGPRGLLLLFGEFAKKLDAIQSVPTVEPVELPVQSSPVLDWNENFKDNKPRMSNHLSLGVADNKKVVHESLHPNVLHGWHLIFVGEDPGKFSSAWLRNKSTPSRVVVARLRPPSVLATRDRNAALSSATHRRPAEPKSEFLFKIRCKPGFALHLSQKAHSQNLLPSWVNLTMENASLFSKIGSLREIKLRQVGYKRLRENEDKILRVRLWLKKIIHHALPRSNLCYSAYHCVHRARTGRDATEGAAGWPRAIIRGAALLSASWTGTPHDDLGTPSNMVGSTGGWRACAAVRPLSSATWAIMLHSSPPRVVDSHGGTIWTFSNLHGDRIASVPTTTEARERFVARCAARARDGERLFVVYGGCGGRVNKLAMFGSSSRGSGGGVELRGLYLSSGTLRHLLTGLLPTNWLRLMPVNFDVVLLSLRLYLLCDFLWAFWAEIGSTGSRPGIYLDSNSELRYSPNFHGGIWKELPNTI